MKKFMTRLIVCCAALSFINMSIAPAEAFLSKLKDKAKEKVMGSPCAKAVDNQAKCRTYKACQWVNGSCTKNKCVSYKTMSKCNNSTKYNCTWSPNKRVPYRLQKTTGGTCKMMDSNVYDQGMGGSYSDPSMSGGYHDPSMGGGYHDPSMGGGYESDMSGESYSSDMAPY